MAITKIKSSNIRILKTDNLDIPTIITFNNTQFMLAFLVTGGKQKINSISAEFTGSSIDVYTLIFNFIEAYSKNFNS